MTEHCDCDFYERSPKAHDLLVAVESMDAPYAAKLVADLISHNPVNVGDEEPLIADPNDFSCFVGQHNWKDPVGMYNLGDSADWLVGKAWHHWPKRWVAAS
jgi:hypothetical protein